MNNNDRYQFDSMIRMIFVSYGGRRTTDEILDAYWMILRYEVQDCAELAVGIREACRESPQFAPSAALIAVKANPPDNLRTMSRRSEALIAEARERLGQKHLPGRVTTGVAQDTIAKVLAALEAKNPIANAARRQEETSREMVELL